MNKRYIFFLLLIILAFTSIHSQTLHTQNKDLPCLNHHFNLAVHIALDSTRMTNFDISSLEGAINGANQMFSPICISFSICEVDTMFNYNFDSLATASEFDEMTAIFKKQNRLNIYIITDMEEPSKCGFGGGTNMWLRKDCTGSFTHEMGHIFGLAHTFEGNGVENVDGSNCETAGDGICDTPADPFDPDDEETVWQEGCEFIYTGLDANGQFYQPDMGNIMSYYGCGCGFTRGQYLRMVSVYNSSHKFLW